MTVVITSNRRACRYLEQTTRKLVIGESYFNTQPALSLLPLIRTTALKDAKMASCALSSLANINLDSLKRSHNKVAVCQQRAVSDPTPLTRAISLSSPFSSTLCLINVISVCVSINLYEAGAQSPSRTNQAC